MLDWIHGHIGAALRSELPRPHPGTKDDFFGSNFALRGGNAERTAVFVENASDAHAGHNGRAAFFRTFSKAKGGLPGVHAAVSGQPHGTANIICLEERPFLPDLVRSDEIDLQSRCLSQRN